MQGKQWSFGVDIGGTKILIVQLNESGYMMSKKKIETEAEKGFDFIFKKILSELTLIINESHSLPTSLGIGIAGQVILEESYLKRAPNLHWSDIPLKKLFIDSLNVPTVVMNDVRAASWGEWKHGAGRGIKDLICIMIGTGIGGGVIIENSLLNGCSGSAGELGHFPIEISGPICSCGNKGCVEALASGWALTFQTRRAILDSPRRGEKILSFCQGNIEKLTSKEIVRAYLESDELACQIINTAVEAIVSACVGYTNIFNPQKILIGGGLGLAIPNLSERIAQGIVNRSLKAAAEVVHVAYSELKEMSVAVGVASYAANKIMQN